MSKEILINASIGETRIAILENKRLVELYYDRPENERMVGDIYYGIVANVVRGMQAAFINIGFKQDAFLHFSDFKLNLADFDTDDSTNQKKHRGRQQKKPPPETILRAGKPILVQVTKEPIAKKGARITTNITIPGRFMVLMPNENIVGVSKKINSRRERNRLKNIGRKIRPKGFGVVIRTVSENKDEKLLRTDLNQLMKSWQRIRRKITRTKPPGLVYKDMGMLSSVIRDLFTEDTEKLVVDSKSLQRDIVRYLKDVSSTLTGRVELYKGKMPLFDYYNIESEVDKSLARKVWLKSGGYIFIDHTEALTAIDVNSGRFIGRGNQEANSLKINLEAAREIARQLRLRDIGGILIIDFIDMLEDKSKKRLQDEFNRELKKDRAQMSVAPLSQFGIVEMTRQRVRPALIYSITEVCPACIGTGRIVSKTTTVARIERWIKRYRREKGDRSIQLVVHPELASFLTIGFNSRLRKINWKYWTRIKVVSEESMSMDEFRVLDNEGQEELSLQYLP